VAAKKRSDFVAIATKRHGAPAAAMRAGIIVKQEAAGGIGAAADGGTRAFDEQFRGGTSKGCEEPVQAAFTGDKLKGPGAATKNQFIVSFRYAKNFINRLDPRSRERLLVDDGREYSAQRLTKAEDAKQGGIDGLRFCQHKRPETRGPLLGNQACICEERYKFIPREVVCCRREIGEIESEPARDEMGSYRVH
jgi:hypothetical protein